MPDPLPELLDWAECQRCPLHETRTLMVPGVGNPNAKVIIYGEGPGPTEDETGYPFNASAGGRSGIELNMFLGRLGWSRDDIFIDNVVGCWPVEDDGERLKTRKPTVDEIRACRPRVEETIYRIDPILIIAMGTAALKGLTDDGTNITKARGDLFWAKIPGVKKLVAYPVYPTFHPAYLLRQGVDNRSNTPKRLFWKDLVQVNDHLTKLRSLYGV